MDPLTIGLTTATLAGQGANMALQGNMNRKNREFALQQYERQRQDELEFWRMNNAYNHPSAQMARLRDSGLNPHLVYGKGTVGNTSGAAHAPAAAKWQGNPLQMDVSGALDQIYNLQAKGAQIDNMRAQNTLLEQEALLKKLGIAKKYFDLGVDYETRGSIINKIMGEGFQALTKNDLNNQQIAKNEYDLMYYKQLKELGIDLEKSKLENLNVDTGNKVLDGELKKLDMMLLQEGINRNDPMWLRIVTRLLAHWGITPTSVNSWLDKKLGPVEGQ